MRVGEISSGIYTSALDLQAASHWLHDSGGDCGAVVLFSGQVRSEQIGRAHV